MWEQEAALAGEAARKAGKALLELFGKDIRVVMKGEIDPVTEADLRSERVILELIARRFPGDSILTEEAGECRRDSGRVWIIDPLDGTVNFAHGFPMFAVSIALQAHGEIVLGVVLNPVLDECFEAREGGGAFLNGRAVAVSRTAELQASLLATGFPYDVHRKHRRVLTHLRRMLTRAQGIRRPGSAAIDLCYVAAGRLDGFWEEGLKPWDTAAGMVIVQEAGGRISTYDGKPYSPYEKNLVASNPFIHEAMIALLTE
ncbi:MAG: inositol monophosphatase family protein [Thermodesulfobacteriota bacterium]